jgi:hypothetical protein
VPELCERLREVYRRTGRRLVAAQENAAPEADGCDERSEWSCGVVACEKKLLAKALLVEEPWQQIGVLYERLKPRVRLSCRVQENMTIETYRIDLCLGGAAELSSFQLRDLSGIQAARHRCSRVRFHNENNAPPTT